MPQASGCVLNPDKAEKLMLRFHDYVLAPDIAPVVFNSEKEKRIGLSLGLRYEILDRDAHTCRYCGRSSPAVELHVDHIISQASWRARFGSLRGAQAISGFQYEDVNDRRNLITSCSDCNLESQPRTVSHQSADQLLCYAEFMKFHDYRVLAERPPATSENLIPVNRYNFKLNALPSSIVK